MCTADMTPEEQWLFLQTVRDALSTADAALCHPSFKLTAGLDFNIRALPNARDWGNTPEPHL